jgi:hypothetical protein
MAGTVALRSGIAEMQTALLVIGGGAGRSRLVAAATEAAAVAGLNGSGLWLDVRRVGRAFTGPARSQTVARPPARN